MLNIKIQNKKRKNRKIKFELHDILIFILNTEFVLIFILFLKNHQELQRIDDKVNISNLYDISTK